jgi:hypothetical protein
MYNAVVPEKRPMSELRRIMRVRYYEERANEEKLERVRCAIDCPALQGIEGRESLPHPLGSIWEGTLASEALTISSTPMGSVATFTKSFGGKTPREGAGGGKMAGKEDELI